MTKIEFCEFLDSIDDKGRIQLKPIGKAKKYGQKASLDWLEKSCYRNYA